MGTLESPVHAENIRTLAANEFRDGSFVIAVDACLGLKKEVGRIIVGLSPLRPGLAVKKELPPIGHMHIAGVVNVGGFMEYMVLQSTRLSLVLRLASCIALGIMDAVQTASTVPSSSLTQQDPELAELLPLPLQGSSR